MKFASYALILTGLLSLPAARAQTATASGHWQGSIQIPDKDLTIEVDLAQNPKGEWMGTIDIPSQGLKGFPLSGVAVKGGSVTFGMKGVPGDPKFDGNLSADGKTLSGGFTQGGANFTFSLKRSGEGVIEVPAKSTAITKDMEGAWEGAMEVGGNKLRLKLNLANQADGTAAGSIITVDQGGAEIPIATITQKGHNLELDMKSIQGTWEGDLAGGELVGHWVQRGTTFPLTFRRPPAEKQ